MFTGTLNKIAYVKYLPVLLNDVKRITISPVLEGGGLDMGYTIRNKKTVQSRTICGSLVCPAVES